MRWDDAGGDGEQVGESAGSRSGSDVPGWRRVPSDKGGSSAVKCEECFSWGDVTWKGRMNEERRKTNGFIKETNI